jgi:hypothetical protein
LFHGPGLRQRTYLAELGAGERIRTAGLPFTRSVFTRCTGTNCTNGTGNRTDGIRCAGIILRVVPRTIPRRRRQKCMAITERSGQKPPQRRDLPWSDRTVDQDSQSGLCTAESGRTWNQGGTLRAPGHARTELRPCGPTRHGGPTAPEAVGRLPHCQPGSQFAWVAGPRVVRRFANSWTISLGIGQIAARRSPRPRLPVPHRRCLYRSSRPQGPATGLGRSPPATGGPARGPGS